VDNRHSACATGAARAASPSAATAAALARSVHYYLLFLLLLLRVLLALADGGHDAFLFRRHGKCHKQTEIKTLKCVWFV
jgi:hypothetical protein